MRVISSAFTPNFGVICAWKWLLKLGPDQQQTTEEKSNLKERGVSEHTFPPRNISILHRDADTDTETDETATETYRYEPRQAES